MARYKLKYVIELSLPKIPGSLTQILMLFGQKEYWGGRYGGNILALGLHPHFEPSPAWVTVKTNCCEAAFVHVNKMQGAWDSGHARPCGEIRRNQNG